VTLVSSDAAVCIHQRPIPGCTNEVGAMPELVADLHDIYGRHHLFDMVTTDAGNTSLPVAGQIAGLGLGYFCQIKSEHGDLYTEATSQLESLADEEADATDTDSQNGQVVTYRLWQYDLQGQGWLKWTHARQMVRVQRVAEDPNTGERSIGKRYYVSNRTPVELRPKACLKVSRRHWRCENETHWTADVALNEDRRRLSWSRHANGVFVVSALRIIALAILAVARKLSRVGHSLETPTWQQVSEHFALVLCGTVLDTERFDAVRS